MRTRVGLTLVLAAAGLLVGACQRQNAAEDQRTGSVTSADVENSRAGWPEGASAQLDSGNAAYSAKDYQEALRHYRTIAEMVDAPQSLKVTAFFGLWMTNSAIGDSAATQAAAEELQKLAPDASLMHGSPMTVDTAEAPPQTPDDSIHRRLSQ